VAKEMMRIEIQPAENGGQVVTHHMRETGSKGMMQSYPPPETHVFGPGDGHGMLAHIATHLNIPKEKGRIMPEAAAKIRAKK